MPQSMFKTELPDTITWLKKGLSYIYYYYGKAHQNMQTNPSHFYSISLPFLEPE